MTIGDPNDLSDKDKNFFYSLLEKKVYQLINFLLQENEKLMSI